MHQLFYYICFILFYRNHVRSKEDRKCRIRKSIEKAKAEKGIVPLKVLQAQRDRAITERKKKNDKKQLIFNKDIWRVDPIKCKILKYCFDY